MEEKCRTCADSSTKMYHMRQKIGAYERTIEDMILTLVPELKGRLQDSDVVCRVCRRLLHQCLKFIEKCFQIDENLILVSKEVKKEETFVVKLENKKQETTSINSDIHDDGDTDKEIFDLTSQGEKNRDADNKLQKHAKSQKYIGDIAEKNDLTVEEKIEMLFHDEGSANEKSKHDYGKGECLAINKLEAPPSSIVDPHNRILSVKLPLNAPEQFVASLATIDVNVFGCSLNTEPSFDNKRVLLIGDNGNGVECEDCEKVFTTKEYLEKHSVRHAKDREVKERRQQMRKKKVELRRKKFKAAKQQLDGLRRKIIKNKENSYMCEQCGKIFHQQAAYSAHKKIHTDGITFICHICGAVLKGSTSLRTHVASVHGERRYPCTLCPKSFKSEVHLKRHVRVTHMKQTRVQCEQCGKSCTSISTLKGHLSLVHRREVKCVCPICGIGLYRKDYLARHLRKHMIDGNLKETRNRTPRPKSYWKDPVPCKICGKIIIRAHMTTHLKCHRAERRFKCSVCGMTFKFKNNQERHEKLHQKDSGKFKCHVCWKSFKNQTDYDEHMTHHNKTYTCPVCDEGFGRKFALKSHLYDVHPDVANSIVDTVDPRYPYKKKFPKVKTQEINRKFKIIRKAVPKYEDEEPGEYIPEHDLHSEAMDEKSQDVKYDEDAVEGYEYLEQQNAADTAFDFMYQSMPESEDGLTMDEQYLEQEEEGKKDTKNIVVNGEDGPYEYEMENGEEEFDGSYEEYIIENENGERFIVKNDKFEKYVEEEGEVC